MRDAIQDKKARKGKKWTDVVANSTAYAE